ncbi:hypothetical protein K443DRAFT_470312 [Laccaria amethystina LaAM-08-1]|uniref:Uncharacterized protein n=1 Tax=Laccaria amethystina LaAM-08-1 TaxID=1095629 RepID=A0A0C9WNB2_9AGAR|nr:hypothetical protein K443DRAFT_470312 [Laccaria amethystina LaAM-08-1]
MKANSVSLITCITWARLLVRSTDATRPSRFSTTWCPTTRTTLGSRGRSSSLAHEGRPCCGGLVKDIIESQHKRSGSLAAAVGSSAAPSRDAVTKFAVANRLTYEGKVNRMEFAQTLMEEGLRSKLERDAMIKSARVKNGHMADVTRKLAHITSIRDAQLATKHDGAVVRGYSHTILVIRTSGARLRGSKRRRTRSTRQPPALWMVPLTCILSRCPLWTGSKVSTSFTMENFTSDPEIIFGQINASLDSSIHSTLAWLSINSPPRTTSNPYSLRLNKPSPRLSPISKRHIPATSQSRKASYPQPMCLSKVLSLHKPPHSTSLSVRSHASKRP